MKRFFYIIVAAVLFVVLCGCNPNSTFNDTHNPVEPDVGLLLDEAYGNPAATKMLFDFADEIGYCPSSVFGPFCFDMEHHVVHDTDSDCVANIPYENRMSCWVYDCYYLERVKKVIETNSYLSQFEWSFCEKCFPNK